MIQAIKVHGGLPGGAACLMATDGDNVIVLTDPAQWGDEQKHYDLFNALFDDLDPSSEGDYALEGRLDLALASVSPLHPLRRAADAMQAARAAER